MTRSRFRPLAVVSLTGALALTLAGPAAAADVADVETTQKGGKTVIEVLATYGDDAFIPKGGEPGDFPEDEDFVPGVGDAFSFEDELSQDGTVVGTQKGLCTAKKVTETEITNDCAGTLTFNDGSLKLVAEIVFALDEEEGEDEGDLVQVVGGTGAYAGATGTAFIKTVDDEHESITATFSTGDGQVSEVPAGGAQTGGVHAGGGNDLVLVGLGATAALGGAVLLGTRVLRRR